MDDRRIPIIYDEYVVATTSGAPRCWRRYVRDARAKRPRSIRGRPFSGGQDTYFVARVPLPGGPPKVLVSSNEGLSAHLSADGTTILYVGGFSGHQALKIGPSDGSAPPTVLRNDLRYLSLIEHHAGRYLVAFGGDLVLLDEHTGNVVVRLKTPIVEEVPCHTTEFVEKLTEVPNSGSIVYGRRLASVAGRQIYEAAVLEP